MTPLAGTEVLVVGSLHRDIVVRAPRLPARDETLPGSAFRLVFGGKGGNQAVAAARMGARTAMLGRVGRDELGRDLLEGLDAGGVDRTLVAVDEAIGSGMSVAILDDRGEYGAVIVSGANLAIPAAEAADAVRTLLPRIVVLQNEIAAEVNRVVAAAAAAFGSTIVWNAAPARAPDPTLLADVSLLVVNRVEAAAMAAMPVETRDDAVAAALLLSEGRRNAVVTLGADGAVLVARDGAVMHVGAIPTTVVSAHGAGDMFVGALAARLAAEAPLADALAFAAGAASLHVGRDETGRAGLDAASVLALIGLA